MARPYIPIDAELKKVFEGNEPIIQALVSIISNVPIVTEELQVRETTKLDIPYYDQDGTKQIKTIKLPGQPDIEVGGDNIGTGVTLPTSAPNPATKILFVLTVQDRENQPGVYYYCSTTRKWELIATSLT